MSPTMILTTEETQEENGKESQYQRGVKYLYENGITKVPNKYILPLSERPISNKTEPNNTTNYTIKLPIIDFAQLQGPNRSNAISSLANACQQFGFFQLVNHGIDCDIIRNIIDISTKFFELPYEERAKYMSSDMCAKVRYGTSFNQNKDNVFCWRDFLKLMCNPISEVLPFWPTSPANFSTLVGAYAKETRELFLTLMEAILESLGLNMNMNKTDEDKDGIKQFEDGSQLMVVNCYPPCPQPDLTLGMPPHSDYGFLTLLLQDEVEGLQIQYQDKWVTVESIANSFVVNVGDHLEIFSNGKYKSVLHRVTVNSWKPRISVASLHSLPFKSMIKPFSKLIDEANPRLYKDTDFATFLQYISSCEPKKKNFLESRKIDPLEINFL